MKRLTHREKQAVMLAAGFIGLFILMQFLVFPLLDKKKRLKTRLRTEKKILVDMQLLKAEFNSIEKDANSLRSRIAAKKQGFTLFSFLEENAGKTGLKDRIAYMKPSSTPTGEGPYKLSTVEMKLQMISMEQLVTYLHAVETSPNMVRVRRLSVSRTGTDKSVIDAVMEFATVDI